VKQGYLNYLVIKKIFLSLVLFSGSLGVFQSLTEQSLGLHFLGEPYLNLDIKGVSVFNFLDQRILRAYGLFAHPNILGGYLALAFVIVKSKWLKALLSVCLLFTFSQLAWLFLVVYYLFNLKKWAYLCLFTIFCFVVFDSSSLSERLYQLYFGFQMFLDNLFGVGLSNSKNLIAKFSSTDLNPWNIQPIHNTFLLIIVEFGLFGLLFLFFLFKNAKFTPLVLAFCVMLFFEHYFYTLFVGQFLVFQVAIYEVNGAYRRLS
jgi:O-antigen ligase